MKVPAINHFDIGKDERTFREDENSVTVIIKFYKMFLFPFFPFFALYMSHSLFHSVVRASMSLEFF